MRAISVKQPWAHWIWTGIKGIETRTWKTDYRGDILIVSSKVADEAALRTDLGISSEPMLYGLALCVVDIVACHPMREDEVELAMCERYEKAYSWVLENIRQVEPFPVKGQLGIYRVDVAGRCYMNGESL